MAAIMDIEGIGKVYAGKLTAAGVDKVETLLKRGADPKGRKALAEATGISEKKILTWVNLADLYRVKGIGEEYSELLEAAGVDTVVELATRNPDNLYAKLVETNEAKKLVRALPTKDKVVAWVEFAKALPRVVTY